MLRFSSLIFLFFFSCSTKEYADIVLDEIPQDQMDFQKMIIAHLSGEIPITSAKGNDVSIHDRWSKKGRRLSEEYLKKTIEAIGLTPEVHGYTITNPHFAVDLLIEPLKGRNVYTTLPSTSGSDEYVLLGAHYDTGGKDVPGAIDNGSGIALILSVLRRAKELKSRNKNLIVIFFDQEEESISAGSISFARHSNDKNLNIHSVHSFDMIGWDADNNKELALELPSKELEEIYKKHAEILNIPNYSTTVNSSDYYSFIKEGINAIGISQAYGKGDHSGKKDTPDDKYPLVNFEYLESSTQLAFEVVKEIIND